MKSRRKEEGWRVGRGEKVGRGKANEGTVNKTNEKMIHGRHDPVKVEQ